MDKILISIFLCFCFFYSDLAAQETLFYCSNETGTYQVNSINFETNEITNITSNSDYNYWWVDISANKDKLVLMRSPIGEGIEDKFDYMNCQMLTTDIDGKNESIIVDYNQNGWVLFGNPRWHPKKDRLLLFTFEPSQFQFYIVTIDSDGTNPVNLTSENSWFADPNWSNDGSKIVYLGLNPSGGPTFGYDDQEIYVASYDYETNTIDNETRLTDDFLGDNHPCFSLDDEHIVFSSGDINKSYADLVMINIDGSSRTTLITDDEINQGPINWGSNNKIYYNNVQLLTTFYGIKEYDPISGSNLNFTSTLTNDFISPRYVNFSEPTKVDLHEQAHDISIIPNPVSTYVNIKVEEKAINGDLHIYSLKGELLLTQKITRSEITIDMSKIASGSYILTCLKDGIQTTQTIIKF